MNKMLNRVPEVTLYFWIIKIMATTVGETGADFLAFTINFGLAGTSYIMSALLAVVLIPIQTLQDRGYVNAVDS